jgi:hypothetical protein
MCELFIGAFFFAMQSCEYLQFSGKRKTKILVLRNNRFFIGNKNISHNHPSLHLADTVSITFEYQKRDIKNDIATHHKTKDIILCPVKVWCKIVHQIISYLSTTLDTTVNTFIFDDGTKLQFKGSQVLQLRLAAKIIGPDNLGFSPNQISLHSARSGAAMAMYLAGVPVFTIMLLGCWSSDAFLRYIRKQVKEFSTSISQKMIIHEHFFNVPTTSQEDPRICQHPLNHASRQMHGHNFKDAIMPLVSVFH